MKWNEIICTAMCIAMVLSAPVQADEITYEKSPSADLVLEENWKDVLDFLPEDIREEAADLNPAEGEGLDDKIGFRYWIERILSSAGEILDGFLPSMLPLFSMLLVISAVEMSIEITPESGLRKPFRLLTTLASSVLLFGITERIMTGAAAYLDRICGVMNLLTPVMEGLYLAGGNLTQKAVTTEAVMLAVTLVGNFSGKLLAPLTNLLFTLSCMSGVCSDVKIGGFTGGLRKTIMRLWQFGTLLFSFLLSVQTILAKSADSLAAKTARFAIGSFIPMAGGVIAEAFSTLKEGISVLKNAAGIGGIIVLLLIMVPGILPLILYKCALSIAETAAEMLNLGEMRGMIADIHGITDMLFAFVLYTSLMFMLVIIIFTKAQVGG